MSERRAGQAFTGEVDAATQKILPSASVTHVHFLRHGEVEDLEQRVVRGQLDVPLSLRGEAQSHALARWLHEHEPRPDVIFSSDLVRCRALADELARQAQRSLICDKRLREQHMGSWEGRTWAQITAAEPAAVSAYWDDYHEARPTKGESFADLEQRVATWWDQLVIDHAGKRVFVVTHIGVIRALLCRLLGLAGDQALRFAPATASHTSVLLGEAGAVLLQVGERPWLFGNELAGAYERSRTPLRIALSGSAGTGKTTLGRRLAAELDLPFIEEGMRKLLESGFDTHSLSTADWQRLFHEMWQSQREEEERAVDGFISDRSSLDFAAFWLHYGLHEEGSGTDKFLDWMFAEAQRYERIVLFPWGAFALVDDGVRSTNRWTQLRFQTILEGLIERFNPARVVRVPTTPDVEERLRFVMRVLGR